LIVKISQSYSQKYHVFMVHCVVPLTSSSCSRRYNYLYSLSLCLELTNSVSVRLLCSQSPLWIVRLTYITHVPYSVCVIILVSCI